jgi:hypothetical protein
MFWAFHKKRTALNTVRNIYGIEMKKKIIAASAIVVWLFLISFFMIASGHVDLPVFFVLWLIGILVVVEMIDTRFSQPVYLKYVKLLVAAGIVIFGIIVTQKVLEILVK